jgi:hypothetical protein
MAIEFTLICDSCGKIIHASRSSAKAARGEAQLQCGAVSVANGDYCADCRKDQLDAEAKRRASQGPFRTHSIGTRG